MAATTTSPGRASPERMRARITSLVEGRDAYRAMCQSGSAIALSARPLALPCPLQPEQSQIVGGELVMSEEVGAAGHRAKERLAAAPVMHMPVVSRKEHLRDRPAAEERGARIMRILQQRVGERVFFRAPLVSQHARDQADRK